jgi:hypothetical protein
MRTEVYIDSNVWIELENARELYGTRVGADLTKWLRHVSDSFSRDESPREETGSDPSRTRLVRVSHSWWKRSEPSFTDAARGLVYALRRWIAPYEFWISERQFSVAGRFHFVTQVGLRVDRVHQRVEVISIDLPHLATGGAASDPGPTPLSVGTAEWKNLTAERTRLIDKKYDTGLTPAEEAELDRLQKLSLQTLDRDLPLPRLDANDLESVRQALARDDQSQR